MSLEVREGQMVALSGRNGMGKSTTVRSIMGLTPPKSGFIQFDEQPIQHLPPYKIAQCGIGLVPEGRHIFPTLTVHENLLATAANRRSALDPWTTERVYDLFPELAERRKNRGNQLSGGEQQMLAIGRALMTNPRLLILDEATEGLAPLVQADIWRCLQTLKAAGHSILVIDKNVHIFSHVIDYHYIIEKGRTVWQGTSGNLSANPQIRHQYLGI